MKRIGLILGVLVYVVISCVEKPQEDQQINYTDLQQVQVDTVLETGESEDYFPGRAREFVVMDDGTILLFDMQKVTIEQFSEEGEHLATVTRQGGGPGEINNYFSMHRMPDGNTLMIRPYNTGQHLFFTPNEEGIYTYNRTETPANHNAMLSISGNRTPSEFYATYRSGGSMASMEKPFHQMPVAVINAKEEILQDSLHMLKVAGNFVERTDQGIRMFGIRLYQYRDMLKVLNSGSYLITRPDSSRIDLYDRNHRLTNRITLNIKPRPLTNEDLDYFLSDYASDTRNKIEDRLGDYKPPFMDVWASSTHLLLFVDEDEQGKQYVVLTREGNPVGQFRLPTIDRIQQFTGNRVYTIHSDSLVGDVVRAYELGIRI